MFESVNVGFYVLMLFVNRIYLYAFWNDVGLFLIFCCCDPNFMQTRLPIEILKFQLSEIQLPKGLDYENLEK